MNPVTLAIKMITDARGASAGIDQVTSKTSKLGTAGKLAGRALAVGLGAAIVLGGQAVKAAAEDEAAQVKLASALQNATGARASDVAAVEDWIAAQGKALGVADDQLRPAMEALVTATGDVAKAQDLATIAMDISARKGVSLESVSKSLAKAQATGNVAALAKYGVATKDAAGKALSLEQVTKNLAGTYKGAAAASAETAAGKQKRLQVAMDELKESIGAKLLPVMLKLTDAGMAIVDWITENQTAALAIIGTLGGLLAIIKLVSLATTIWSTATKIAAASQAIFNAVMAANPVVLIVVAVIALAAALVLAYKKSETFRKIVNAVFGAIADKVGAVVGFIKDHWKTMLAILAGPIGLAVLLIVKHRDKIQAAIGAARDWIAGKWSAVKDLLSGPVEKARNLISAAVEGVRSAIGTIKTKADEIGGKVKSALDAAFAPIQWAIDQVQNLIDKLGQIKDAIPDIDIPLVGRSAVGLGTGSNYGSLAPAGQVVNININVTGYVGDEITLMRKIRDGLADDLRRLGRTG